MRQSARLRAALAQPQPILSIGVFDCFSAKIAEHAGFQLVSISGNTLTAKVISNTGATIDTFTVTK